MKSVCRRASNCSAVMNRSSPSERLIFCICMVRVKDSIVPSTIVVMAVKSTAVRAMASTAIPFRIRLAAKLRRVRMFSISSMGNSS